MRKWLFLIICVGVAGVIGKFLWKTKPDVGRQTSLGSTTILHLEPTATPTPEPKKITIAAVGDIGLGREANYQIIQKNNPNFAFEKIADFIKTADISTGNLEGPVIDNCPIVRSGFQFCGRPENIQGLKYAGFKAMSLANNHINNYGEEGLNQTIEKLEKNNIGYFYNQKAWFTQVKGTKFAFLGFDDTVERIMNYELQAIIEKTRNNTDILVVNFHWGEEYQPLPNNRQRELAELAIDAGADVVIGHHPHVIQPLEYYQDKPIFYSLGNFAFDQMWSEETKTGAIGLITIENNQIVNAETRQVYTADCCQPELID